MTAEEALDFTVYRGRLAALLPVLSIEARALPPGQWARRDLPRGARVAVCYDGTVRVCRIARDAAPRSLSDWEKWAVEIKTFINHLGLKTWHSVHALPWSHGGSRECEVFFREPGRDKT